MDFERAAEFLLKQQAKHDAWIAEHRAMMREHDARMREHDARMRKHDARMEKFDQRLTRLEKVVAVQHNDIAALTVVARVQQGQISQLLGITTQLTTEIANLKKTVESWIRANGHRGNGRRKG